MPDIDKNIKTDSNSIFYDRFMQLCKKKGVACSKVLYELGHSRGATAYWRRTGSIPKSDILQKIANYFDVSTDYLLGKEIAPTVPGESFENGKIVVPDNDEFANCEMPIMQQYFDLECNLYAANQLSTEVKAAQAWGILSCACRAGEITWDRQRLLFGEFMWKLLKLG